MKPIFAHFVAGAALVAVVATPALATKADKLTYLNGMDAERGERELIRLGFRNESSHRSSGGYVNSYWWQSDSKNCVMVETYFKTNQIMTVSDATNKDCGHSGSISGGEAVAIGVGAALLGALIGGSKSHHREGADLDTQQTAEFDRGYSDGLHNAPYHNYSRADAYAKGYEKGTEERSANLSYHHGRGGYAPAVNFKDLEGARAAGAMDTLSDRGFRQVDNFTSGNTRYSIQWQPSTRQCVQVTIADGRFVDVSDIDNHPNCR